MSLFFSSQLFINFFELFIHFIEMSGCFFLINFLNILHFLLVFKESFNISFLLVKFPRLAGMSLGANLMEFIEVKFVIGIIVIDFRSLFLFLFSHIVDLYNIFIIIIIIKFCMASSDFDQNFLEAFDALGKQVSQKYSKTIENYQKYIIPFQIKRMKQNQSLSFKNTSLQRDKLELLKKIEQLSSQNHRQQYIMQKQSDKINDLQKTVAELNKANDDNLSIIEVLKLTSSQLEQSLNQKIKIVKQVEQDKAQVLKTYQSRNNQFNGLLSNYMREKNIIAQKLNEMNDLEQLLMDKQKKIKEQQFYLKKQWEQFEQAKKQAKQIKKQVKQAPRIFKKPSNRSEEDKQQQQKPKYERQQILRNPVKKIIKHHNNQIYDLAFNYNGTMIATCGGDRMIKIYDVANYKSGINIQGGSTDNIYLCLSLDYAGEKLLTGSTNNSVQIFSTSSGKALHTFVGHGYKVNSVSWSSAKQKCVSGSEDKQIKIWQIEKASNLLSIPCGKAVKVVSCNAVQPVIYSGHSDGSVRIYSLNQANTPIAQIKGIIDYPINSVVVLSNRHQILVSSQQGTPIHLMDLKMNKTIQKYEQKQFYNTMVRAQLSPTQKYVVAGNCDGYIYYWNKDKQTFQKKISGHQAAITTLKYHFLSNVLASCDKQGNVIIWQ